MDRVEYEKIIVQDIVNWAKNRELNINPWYQRRSCWVVPQQSFLINTLFEQKPIPSLYIRHSLDLNAEKSIREVVDGQQRIRAILEFIENKYQVKHPAHEKKLLYKELSRSEQETFKLTGLSVGYLLGATDEDVVEIFGRLNSVSKSLNAQEKRNAKFSGEFKQFCLREAALRLPIWRDLGIFTGNDVSRMQEVQFISDLALNLLQGLSDFNNKTLDSIYKKYDEEFLEHNRLKVRFESLFCTIASINPDSIKNTVFNRQPLLFSLLIVLDSIKKKLAYGQISDTLFNIDALFQNASEYLELGKAEADFISACMSSTQRIKSRKIRHSFILNRLK